MSCFKTSPKIAAWLSRVFNSPRAILSHSDRIYLYKDTQTISTLRTIRLDVQTSKNRMVPIEFNSKQVLKYFTIE